MAKSYALSNRLQRERYQEVESRHGGHMSQDNMVEWLLNQVETIIREARDPISFQNVTVTFRGSPGLSLSRHVSRDDWA